MTNMKTSWPTKLDAKIQFCCFSFIALLFCVLDIFEPATISVKGLLIQAFFVGVACFYGYQIFFRSENWFRQKQETDEQNAIQWRTQRPALYYLVNYGVLFLVIAYSLLQIYLHKH